MAAAADIALVTEARYLAPATGGPVALAAGGALGAEAGWYQDNILEEDRLLGAALAARGLSSVRVDWADPGVDWAGFRCALLRSPWDYPDRFDAFSGWIDRVAAATRLVNPRELVRWNLDKHYLAALAARGVAVVPTRYLEAGGAVSLAELCDRAGWTEVVVKPARGAAARDTHRVPRRDAAAHQAELERLVADRCMMVQEFQRDILGRGEVTLMVLGGTYSHAVRKVARPGDFRVQDDYGGSLHDYRPEPREVEFAERAVAVAAALCGVGAPVYGRVDLVRGNDGRPAVMELELIEPELWFRRHPPAAERVTDLLADRLAGGRA